MAFNVKKAVILAAGKGVRLDRPDTPKPLVTVGNKPMILWNIEQLQQSGVKEIYIVVGFRGEEIKKELTNNKAITAKLHYIEQKDFSKGGMLKSVLSLQGVISGPFFLVVSDLVSDKNPYDVFSGIKESEDKKLYTVVSCEKNNFDRSGALSRVVVADNIVEKIGRELEKFSGLELGAYYFTDNILDEIKSILDNNKKIKNFEDVLNVLANDKKLLSVEIKKNEWFDINTPATHVRAEIFARNLNKINRNYKNTENMVEEPVFSNFYREKMMRTNIFIKRGFLDDLDKIKIIPENRSESPHFIITDSVVDKLYGDKVLNKLLSVGYDVKKLVVPTGEEYKRTSEFVRLADEIFTYGMDKNSILISLGGGVVNNISGFLASTLYRGIGLIHIPTTTMAQVDAAIDFKQAVNSPKGKNLLGSYYPAMSIIIDPNVLSTLSDRHIRNGIAESIKHALTQEKEFLDYLLDNADNIKDIGFLENVIRKTIELKVPLLNGDVKDDFNEMLPQYGHSTAHSVEHLSSYDLLHGEAVSVGMCITAEIAKLLKICDDDTVDAHYEICSKYKLPVNVPDYITEDDIINVIKYDKHHIKNGPVMALIKEVGDTWNDNGVYGAPIDYDVLKRAIKINKSKVKIQK